MNYVMNDFSLRGQFEDVETFFDSIRAYTGPVLKKIEAEKGWTDMEEGDFLAAGGL